jgi:drug/metabolite transporter (DMT)-like permease
MLGLMLALSSALVWGSADFLGGLAARRMRSLAVLTLATLSGTLVLIALAVVCGEGVPAPAALAWSMAAGLSGAVGMAALYQGLAVSTAAVVASTAAVTGVLLPTLFGMLSAGIPDPERVVGFVAGIGGVGLVSLQTGDPDGELRRGLGLALAAGAGFGGFFILISQVDGPAVFAPLAVAKGLALLVAVGMLLLWGREGSGSGGIGLALATGVLDAGGNVLYFASTRFTRLDVAVVLASLYSAITVVLTRLVLKERVNPVQGIGVILCALAVAMMTL